jgi:hypothetical protein
VSMRRMSTSRIRVPPSAIRPAQGWCGHFMIFVAIGWSIQRTGTRYLGQSPVVLSWPHFCDAQNASASPGHKVDALHTCHKKRKKVFIDMRYAWVPPGCPSKVYRHCVGCWRAQSSRAAASGGKRCLVDAVPKQSCRASSGRVRDANSRAGEAGLAKRRQDIATVNTCSKPLED